MAMKSPMTPTTLDVGASKTISANRQVPTQIRAKVRARILEGNSVKFIHNLEKWREMSAIVKLGAVKWEGGEPLSQM